VPPHPAQNTTPVLIVGAGPGGLFAACELLRHGVRPRIVESRFVPHTETRATALQPAVLELIDRGGLIEPFLRAGVRIRRIQLLGPGLREIAIANFADTGCEYEFRCSLPQWRTEAILREHLASLGLEVEFGIEVASIEDDPAGLRVTLDGGGRTEIVTVAHMLAAGGGHDATRRAMHEHLAGQTYDGRYIAADVKVLLRNPPECGRVIVGSTGFGLVSPLPDDRWLIFVNRDEADTRSEPPTESELSTLINARTGVDMGLSDLRWVSYFKMHKRTVEHLSDGRRFLLGDAGHLSSPLGGEGLNTAFMDAADIAWKLALVVRGAAKPSLLDSYATERGLADHHALEVSDEVHGSVMKLVAMCADGGAPTLDARCFLPPPSTTRTVPPPCGSTARTASVSTRSGCGTPMMTSTCIASTESPSAGATLGELCQSASRNARIAALVGSAPRMSVSMPISRTMRFKAMCCPSVQSFPVARQEPARIGPRDGAAGDRRAIGAMPAIDGVVPGDIGGDEVRARMLSAPLGAGRKRGAGVGVAARQVGAVIAR